MLTSTHHHSRAPKRDSAARGDRHVGQELRTCDFAWEFGWSCHGRQWSGPSDGERRPTTLTSSLDRALALAG